MAPKTTASGVVQAGHPGVNAASDPPSTADESDFIPAAIFILWIRYAIIAMLMPPSAEIANVRPREAAMYAGSAETAISK